MTIGWSGRVAKPVANVQVAMRATGFQGMSRAWLFAAARGRSASGSLRTAQRAHHRESVGNTRDIATKPAGFTVMKNQQTSSPKKMLAAW